jgi:hypothetical protein
LPSLSFPIKPRGLSTAQRRPSSFCDLKTASPRRLPYLDGEWIAVEDEGGILERDRDFKHLLRKLRDRGLDPGRIFVGYVSWEPLVAIL